ncbi:MAG TPA: hypothetical protein ENK14_10795, partial [Caldithrix sp.]|nr:hypothetical protein [Caldithrix sp.]
MCNYLKMSIVSVLMLFAINNFATDGFSGNALDFDGNNDYVNCGHDASLDITTYLTIEAWIYYRGGETYPRIVQKSPAYTMLIYNSSGKLGWYGYIGGTEVDIEFSDAVIPTNIWTHVAVTYNGSALKAYINGEEKNSESYSGYIQTTANSLLLGNRSAGDRTFDGRMDEVRIWNTARTTEQINENMLSELIGSESGLVSYWKFNESSGTNLPDQAGSNDGTLHNMTNDDWLTSGAFTGPRNAVELDGLDDRIRFIQPQQYSGTMEFWWYPNSFFNYNTIFDNFAWANKWEMWCYGDGRLAFRVDNGKVEYDLDNLQGAAHWYHIAVTWNNHDETLVDYNLYVNGILRDSEVNKTWQYPSNAWDLGGSHSENDPGSGKFDEFRFWSDIRSEQEIRENMCKTLTGNESGLLIYYRFDQTAGDVVYDLTSNNNHGSLVNDDNDEWVESNAFNIWVGSMGTDWATSGNWSKGTVPNVATANVGIPGISGGNQPVISGNYTCNNLSIPTNATLTINSGQELTTNGNAFCYGTQSGDGKIKFTDASIIHGLAGDFNNIELDESNGAEMGGDVTINGTLTLTSGDFSIGANTLTLKNAISGTAANLSAGSTSSITISGSGSGVNIPSSISALNNFTLDNANGSAMQADLELDGTLTLTSGDLDLNGYTIILGTSATLSESEGNTITGSSGVITTTRTFNVGDLSSGSNIAGLGAEITTAAALGSTTISRSPAQSHGISILRYFDIVPTNNTGLNATLTFHYDDSELNEQSESGLQLYRSTDSGNTWALEGGTVDTENETLTLTGINAFSRWTALGEEGFFNTVSLTDVWLGSVVWGDYDNDGDLDILLTGDDGSIPISRIYRNNGGNSFTNVVSLIGVNNSAAAWGDYDNDSDLDILLTGYTITGNKISRIYRNDGGNSFTNVVSLTGVYFSAVAWGDYDNDGDLDILLTGNAGSSPISHIYRNDGSDSFTHVVSLTGVKSGSVAWGDYDNDGDLDIVLTGWSGSSDITYIYRNNGSDSFAHAFTLIGVGGGSSVAWGDYDNDGDLDILLTGKTGSSSISRIYRNDGSNTFVDINAGLVGVFESSAVWGDYDNDGDLDILLAGRKSSGGRTSRIYRNEGSDVFTNINAGLTGTDFSSVAWGDYDNDGDLDILLTGAVSGSYPYYNSITYIYRNDRVNVNTPPSSPANLSVSVSGQEATISWDKSTDNQTAQNGLTYNIRVGTTSGGEEIQTPMANASNGYRRLPVLGNTNHNNSWSLSGLGTGTYYCSVQAIDNAFTGSGFCEEVSFEISVATVSTASITNITVNSATGGGNVTDEGGSSVTAKGVVWHTSPNPTVDTYTGKSNDGSGLGSFTSSLGDLTSGQTYYVRAYATNSQSTGYGKQKVFAPNRTPPGNALDFDGSNDYVTVPNSTSLDIGNNKVTLEMWVKLTTLPGNISEDFESIYGSTQNSYIFYLDKGNQELRFKVKDADGTAERPGISQADLSIGEWLYISGVYDGATGTAKIYLNGNLMDIHTNTGLTENILAGQVAAFGRNGTESEYYFAGQIEEASIWNTARSQTEIRENMNIVLDGDEVGLVAYYRFDHISGTALSDRTTNDNDGILYNMDDTDWIDSSIPLGTGFVNTQIVNSTGNVVFSNTDLEMDFTAKTGTDTIVVNKLELAPNINPTEPDTVFDSQYWVVNRFGSGTFDADLTFAISEDLTAADESNPENIALFTRSSTSDTNWVFLTSASSVNAANNEATFDGITEFSQFIIGRWLQYLDVPQNVTIDIVGTDVQLTWDEVNGANSYKIYASDDP